MTRPAKSVNVIDSKISTSNHQQIQRTQFDPCFVFPPCVYSNDKEYHACNESIHVEQIENGDEGNDEAICDECPQFD